MGFSGLRKTSRDRDLRMIASRFRSIQVSVFASDYVVITPCRWPMCLRGKYEPASNECHRSNSSFQSLLHPQATLTLLRNRVALQTAKTCNFLPNSLRRHCRSCSSMRALREPSLGSDENEKIKNGGCVPPQDVFATGVFPAGKSTRPLAAG